MNKQLLTIAFVLLACVSFAQSNYHTPYDPGAARNTLSNVTPATGRAALGLGTMAVATSTDYVATSALALRLDTTNASISNNLDVAGNVGAATVNGVAPLTAAEKTQALVGSPTVDFLAQAVTAKAFLAPAAGTSGLQGLPTAMASAFVVKSAATGEIATLSVLLKEMGKSSSLQRGRLTITGTIFHLFSSSFYVSGNSDSVVEIDDVLNKTSVASGTAASLNIYSVGGGEYEIQNNTGAEARLLYRWEGN